MSSRRLVLLGEDESSDDDLGNSMDSMSDEEEEEDEEEDEDGLASSPPHLPPPPRQEEDKDEEEEEDNADFHEFHEFNRPQEWDEENGGGGGGGDGHVDYVMFESYTQVVEGLPTIQTPDITYDALKSALDVTHHHFTSFSIRDSVFQKALELLGCEVDDTGEEMIIMTSDAKFKGKDAIRHRLSVCANTIVVIHLAFMKCMDERATISDKMFFVTDELNIKFAELYYRKSMLMERLLLDHDIVHYPAQNSQMLLNTAMTTFREHAAFYRFVQGAPGNQDRKGRSTDMLFMLYLVIENMTRMGFRLKDRTVCHQKMIPKSRPIPDGVDAEGFPVYPCAFTSKSGKRCGVLRCNHKHPITHLYKVKFEVEEHAVYNTHFWEPISDEQLPGLRGSTIVDFIHYISRDNGQAEAIIMANTHLPDNVEGYIMKSCNPMIRVVDPGERTYACKNGIVDSAKFIPYEELKPEHESMCVGKYFDSWYFHEEDERAKRGRPCLAHLEGQDEFPVPRPPEFRFDGFVQNVYCNICKLPKDKADHSKCGYHTQSSSSSSSAVTNKWVLLCAGCTSPPEDCKCEHGPTVYRLGAKRFLKPPTIHWDTIVKTQTNGMTISHPSEPRKSIPLPVSQREDMYLWETGLAFRSNYRIGPLAKSFDGDENTKNKSKASDCFRIAYIIKGTSGVGKTEGFNMIKPYFPKFGNITTQNTDKFMLEQCIDPTTGKFYPINLPEMGPRSLGREIFCQLVDASSEVPVNRKGLTDVNAICDRPINILTNEFGVLGGNMQDSVSSRGAMVEWNIVVPPNKMDGMLQNRNANDPIPLLIKGNSAYEYIATMYGHTSFWTSCPSYFLDIRAKFEEESNPLRQFLKDPISDELGPLVRDPDIFMAEKDLVNAFKAYCERSGIGKAPRWKRKNNPEFKRFQLEYASPGTIFDEDNNPLNDDRYIRGIGPYNDPRVSRILAEKSSGEHPIDTEVDPAVPFMDAAMNAMEVLKQVLRDLDHHSTIPGEFVEALKDDCKIMQDLVDKIPVCAHRNVDDDEFGNLTELGLEDDDEI